MDINLSEKLKSLRAEKGVSQEKLASYLNISVQAVSKWETGNAYPDITLLPPISRFYGITVDELLQAEVFDEHQLYREYEERACELFRNGKYTEHLELWQEAYEKMPNNLWVKEKLMSSYYDADKKKYQNEIIELGSEICNSDADIYYKGQAIEEIAIACAANGNMEMAERWASKAFNLMHSQEFIYMEILKNGEELINYFTFANLWYFHKLFYMFARLTECENIPCGASYTKAVAETIIQLYETVYPNDDMDFEDLMKLCILHWCAAEDEIDLSCDENTVKSHILRAYECAVKSMSVKDHEMTHPLVAGRRTGDAPSDNRQIVRSLKEQLSQDCFDRFRDTAWFTDIEKLLSDLL